MRRWAAKNTRPTVGSASTTDQSSGPIRRSGSMMAGAWVSRPRTTASSRACQHASKVVCCATSSNAMPIPIGLIDPNAATTASGPAGPSGAQRPAM